MQLKSQAWLLALATVLLGTGIARAEDRADFTTTWYQEKRRGPLGGLTVLHPQLDLGVDIGDNVALGAGYAADVVTGATAAVFSTDAISSATKFNDTRHEGNVSLGFAGSRSSLSLALGVASERDYGSVSGTISGNIDLPGKNTNLALSYTHNRDEVCDRDNAMLTAFERVALTGFDECKKKSGLFGEDMIGATVWRDLSIDTVQGTITQNFSPTLVLQVGGFGQVLHGFQANPYRRVRVGDAEAQEAVPDVRGRLALQVRANKYLESVKSAIHGSIRGYADTWDVRSITLEMAYSQYLGQALLVRFRGRVHQQAEAKFFKDAFFYETEGSAGAYFTGDRELGAVRNVLFGGKLTYIAFNEEGGTVWAVFDEIRLNLKGDILLLDELPSNPIEANREGIDNQFLSSSQFLDAFVIQLGLLMRY